MRFAITLSLLVASFSSSFAASMSDRIEKMNWNGIDVVWVQDSSLPTFHISVYFADGALSDHKYRLGETQMMFELLTAGSTRYNQKQVSDALDYFGTRFSSSVYHEYSTLNISGLMKDMQPTVKMVCHLMNDATYPAKEVKSYRSRLAGNIKNMVSNHSALADRVFRKVSLYNTPFRYPAGGELRTIKNIGSRPLKKKLTSFNEKVHKRIYVSGPSDIKNLEHIFAHDCGWTKNGSLKRVDKVSYQKKPRKNPVIYFATVPKANQAQIRLGRVVDQKVVLEHPQELMSLTAGFLGGGFTSQLVQELRVNRGLTYSAGASAGKQNKYGRSIISTFSKNETVRETIEVIKELLSRFSGQGPTPKQLELTQNYMAGSHLFSFESSRAFLNNLLYFDHIDKDYNDLYTFPDKIRSYQSQDVAKMMGKLYQWDGLAIVVVGNKALEKELKKIAYVKKVKLKNYL